MKQMRLGRTRLVVSGTAFGALPVQRVEKAQGVAILRAAHEGGITFFDTARAYSDSEEKLGAAFGDRRDKVVIATKSGAATGEALLRDFETSLRMLRTDYVDIYQFHNPTIVPKPGDGTGLYEAMLSLKTAGKVRHIGITAHGIRAAREAVLSGLYETLQFPFSHLAGQQELELVALCRALDVGFIAMKALSGGLLNDAATAYAWMAQYDNVLPIWGIQRMSELEEFLALANNPPALTQQLLERVEADRKALGGEFCRGCGYCLPCPADIPINMAARMKQLLTRAPVAPFMSEEWNERMRNVKNCTHCGACAARCPYGLTPEAMLPAHYAFYEQTRAEYIAKEEMPS